MASRPPSRGRDGGGRPSADGGPRRRAGASDQRALGRVDGPRGQREGAGVVARRKRNRSRGRLAGGLVALVLFMGVMVVGVFPTRTWFSQRTATADSEAELRDLRAERAAVRRETERLQSGSEVERRAREDLGYVKPGEKAYAILPGQSDPTGLPNQWPFVGVERALSAG